MGSRLGGSHGFAEGYSLDALQFGIEKRVRLILYERRYVTSGRPAVRRIVFEAAILGRIVRGRDDNAVGEPCLPSAVVLQDGM